MTVFTYGRLCNATDHCPPPFMRPAAGTVMNTPLAASGNYDHGDWRRNGYGTFALSELWLLHAFIRHEAPDSEACYIRRHARS